jgi:Uma2 family endonuclease
MQSGPLDRETIPLERRWIRFPIELRAVEGFRAEDLATWPRVQGRLEYVRGRLWYMPPSAEVQQVVAVDVAYVLRGWAETHRDFVVGGNEAGMKLGDDVRAADVAVWRVADVGPATQALRRVPPVLAVEVAGADEDEDALSSKATWYIAHAVTVVWIVWPSLRVVDVVTGKETRRYSRDEQIAPRPELPDLAPQVAQLFAQLDKTWAMFLHDPVTPARSHDPRGGPSGGLVRDRVSEPERGG